MRTEPRTTILSNEQLADSAWRVEEGRSGAGALIEGNEIRRGQEEIERVDEGEGDEGFDVMVKQGEDMKIELYRFLAVKRVAAMNQLPAPSLAEASKGQSVRKLWKKILPRTKVKEKKQPSSCRRSRFSVWSNWGFQRSLSPERYVQARMRIKDFSSDEIR